MRPQLLETLFGHRKERLKPVRLKGHAASGHASAQRLGICRRAGRPKNDPPVLLEAF